MKGDKAQVRGRALAADEPLLIGELVIKDLQYVADLFDVAGAGLRVGFDKGPKEDALEGRSLCGGLELEPLLHVVLLWQGGEANPLLGIVLVEDIVHDSARLRDQQFFA